MAAPRNGPSLGIFPARADISVPAGVVGPEAFSFDVHAFVVRRGNEIALVDALMQPAHTELIGEALARAGGSFADLGYVVVTHHHPDHSGGLAEIALRAPQAQILGGAGDLDAIRESTGVSAAAAETGDEVLGLEVIETPGHTPGHLCLFDPASSTMMLGDIAGNSGGLRRAPAQFTEDAGQAEATLRALAERNFENAYPSHGDPMLGGASTALRHLAAAMT